jgi:hypothetical protein
MGVGQKILGLHWINWFFITIGINIKPLPKILSSKLTSSPLIFPMSEPASIFYERPDTVFFLAACVVLFDLGKTITLEFPHNSKKLLRISLCFQPYITTLNDPLIKVVTAK